MRLSGLSHKHLGRSVKPLRGQFASRVAFAMLAFYWVIPSHSQRTDALWSGQIQCTLSLQFPGYTHQEIQTWMLTGEAPKLSGAMAVYPAIWSVSSSGAGQRTINGQFIASQWKSNVAPMSAPIAMFVRMNNRLVIKTYHAQVSSPKALAVTRQVSLLGANPSQTTLWYPSDEWMMPSIEEPSTSTSISGSGTTPVGATSIPERPGGSNQVANCTWQFARSSKEPNSTVSIPVASPLQPPLSRPPTSGPAAQSSSTSTTRTPSSTTGSNSSSKNGVNPLQMLPPSVSAGIKSLSLSWNPPSNDGGSPVDSYEIEMNSGSFSSDLTTSGPAMSYVVTASACPSLPVLCMPTNLRTYKFRMRAHNKSGPGPYSNYSLPVRPRISYAGDGVSDLWRKLQCNSCHMHQNGSGHVPYLDGPSSTSYNDILAATNVIASPAATSHLLTYPSHQAGHCGNSPQQFSVSSPEYMLVYQWIADGHVQ